MVPIALGIAAIAAVVLSACGGDDENVSRANDNNRDSGVDGTGGAGGSGGSSGASGSGAAAGRGGASGSGGTGGTGGTGGSGGSSGLDGSAGMDGSSFVDASSPDASSQIPIAYNMGLIYGPSYSQGLRGTAVLFFADKSSCKLLGGNFDGEFQSGGTIGFSVDLSTNPNINLCGSDVTLPLAGGIFEGGSMLLTNTSQPLSSKEKYTISSCTSQADGGASVENCSGDLFRLTP